LSLSSHPDVASLDVYIRSSCDADICKDSETIVLTANVSLSFTYKLTLVHSPKLESSLNFDSSNSLVRFQPMDLPPGNYEFTCVITDSKLASGQSSIKFQVAASPKGGSCQCSIPSAPSTTSLVTCSGWNTLFPPLSYRFGFEFNGGIVQLSTTIEPKQALILPPGNVTIRVDVCDVISSCRNSVVARIFIPPVVFSLDSSAAFSLQVDKTIKSGHVDKFLLSALSAATAIQAQSRSQTRNRRLTQEIDLVAFSAKLLQFTSDALAESKFLEL